VTQTYLSSLAITAPFVPRQASAAGRLRPNAEIGQVGTGTGYGGMALELSRNWQSVGLARLSLYVATILATISVTESRESVRRTRFESR